MIDVNVAVSILAAVSILPAKCWVRDLERDERRNILLSQSGGLLNGFDLFTEWPFL